MKSPTYILKNLYQERESNRILETHAKKLQEINSVKSCISNKIAKQTSQINSLMLKRKNNSLLTTQFQKNEQKIEFNRENKSLIERMVEYQLKNDVPQIQNFCQSTTTLHSAYNKKELQRINLENSRQTQRISNLRPVISTKCFESQFQKLQNDVKLQSRFHILKNSVSSPRSLVESQEGKKVKIMNIKIYSQFMQQAQDKYYILYDTRKWILEYLNYPVVINLKEGLKRFELHKLKGNADILMGHFELEEKNSRVFVMKNFGKVTIEAGELEMEIC